MEDTVITSTSPDGDNHEETTLAQEQVHVSRPIITASSFSWCTSFDIRVAAELTKIGCCPICILRYANVKNESMYQLSEADLIKEMFTIPAETVSIYNQTLQQATISTKEESQCIYSSIDDIPSPMMESPTNEALLSLLEVIKNALFDRSICVCCLDLFTPDPKFYDFIGDTVISADYEFTDLSLFKNIPANIIIRQFGAWKHIQQVYSALLPRFKSDTYESLIVELKEGSRYVHNPRIIAAINNSRSRHNTAIKNGEPGLVPIQKHSYATPQDTRLINQQDVVFNNYSRFHVNIVFMAESIEHEDVLRTHLDTSMKKFTPRNQSDQRQIPPSSLSVNSNLMKTLPKVHIDVLKRLEICPPKLPSSVINENSVIKTFGSCHVAQQLDKVEDDEEKFYHAKRIKKVHCHERSLDITDLQQSNEKSNSSPNSKLIIVSDNLNGVARGNVTIVTPYLCCEVSCQHDNILLEANYMKLSRVTSQTSWYMEPVTQKEAARALGLDMTEESEPAEAEANSTQKNDKTTCDQESVDLDYVGPIVETAVDAELAFRILPHFRPSDPGLNIRPPVYCRGIDGAPLRCEDILSPYTYTPGDMNRNLQINLEHMVNASGYKTKFHSSGREDLNVRMLGDGRPMFLELVNPRRTPKLSSEWLRELEKEVNAHTSSVKLLQLREGSQHSFDQMVRGIAEKRKKYRCVVYCETPLAGPESLDVLNSLVETKEWTDLRTNEKITQPPILKIDIGKNKNNNNNNSKLNQKSKNNDNEGRNDDDLQGFIINQLTPIRVLFRRTAMSRTRSIYSMSAKYINNNWFYLDLETQAGTYVKEFVHSDRGRTSPSITQILNVQCTITQLDVSELVM